MGGWIRLVVVAAMGTLTGAVFGQVPSLTLLGLPAGRSDSFVTGISADGGTVVGYNRLNEGGDRAYVWTRSGGMNEFGSAPGVPTPTRARAVSSDGSVIVGDRSGFTTAEAFRYSNGNYQNFPTPSGNDHAAALGLSGNAGVMVGVVGSGTGPSRPMRWTQATGSQRLDLPRAGDIGGWFTGVSRDGRVAIGISGGSTAAQFDPFTWTEADGWRQLPVPGGVGTNYSARTVSANHDGSAIVGYVRPATTPTVAVVWSSGQVRPLLTLGSAWEMSASGTDDRGSIIVGSGYDPTNVIEHAVVWLGGSTPVDLQDYLQSLGVSVPSGWRLAGCSAVSMDGLTIAGVAQRGSNYQAFIATIPSPSVTGLAVISVFMIAPRRVPRWAALGPPREVRHSHRTVSQR